MDPDSEQRWSGYAAAVLAFSFLSIVLLHLLQRLQGLRVYLAQLRCKLEPDPARPRHLLTEAGLGYRFLAEGRYEGRDVRPPAGDRPRTPARVEGDRDPG